MVACSQKSRGVVSVATRRIHGYHRIVVEPALKVAIDTAFPLRNLIVRHHRRRQTDAKPGPKGREPFAQRFVK